MLVISLESVIYVEALNPSAINLILVNIIGLVVSFTFIFIIILFIFLLVYNSVVVSSLTCSTRVIIFLVLFLFSNAFIYFFDRICPMNWIRCHCSDEIIVKSSLQLLSE